MNVKAKTGLLLLALNLSAAAAPGDVRLVGGTDDLAQWREPRGDWFTASAVRTNAETPKLLAASAGQGSIVNGKIGKTKELLSKQEFGDAEIHVEFLIAQHSNSGVYVMGSYEVQVYDSFGVAKDKYPGIECGGIYQRWADGKGFEGHSPRVNASKAPGEWQSFDITFRAPRFDAAGKKIANAVMVKVVHNGQVVHEQVELTGPTRGGAVEKAAGPLRLQGDHGPVAYRNIVVRPLAAGEKP
jgi:hypothetical protein